MPIDQLLLFITAGLLLNVTPGPDVLFIVTHTLRSGLRAGIVASLGITSGCFVHIVAAAVGVSALIAASATAFTVLKWIGAAYLVWVGWKMLRARSVTELPVPAGQATAPSGRDAARLRSIFFQGFGTNVLNPKVALFFLAFLPQFIGPGIENKPLAFLLLGLLFNFNGLWVAIAWAGVAAWLARRYAQARHAGAPASLSAPFLWLERAAGAMFLGFGIKLALSDTPGR